MTGDEGAPRRSAPRTAPEPGGPEAVEDAETGEPCLRCGWPLPPRLMGCKGGHCPQCGHLYPHGDCSD